VLYVCENNQYGEAMPVKEFVPIPNISSRAGSYGIQGRTVDGMDVQAVGEAAAEAVEALRKGQGPVLLETVTYRYRGHYLGDPDNYRTKAEIEEWRRRDPIDRLRRQLMEQGKVGAAELKELEEKIEKEAEQAQEWALRQPKATLEYATSNVLVPLAGRNA
jgi:TPP-dependent pyruvate/acetoin dehydrogenase alpha subunit